MFVVNTTMNAYPRRFAPNCMEGFMDQVRAIIIVLAVVAAVGWLVMSDSSGIRMWIAAGIGLISTIAAIFGLMFVWSPETRYWFARSTKREE